MRIPRILFVTYILTILGPAAGRAVAEAPRAVMAERHRPLLTNHCVKCHGAEAESGVRLDDLSRRAEIRSRPRLLPRV